MALHLSPSRFLVAVLLPAVLCARGFAQEGRVKKADRPDYEAAIDAVRRVARTQIERGAISGASVALVDGQETVLAEGFGLADRERPRPATAETVYRVGSLSKLFTALAAVQLVEQGKLDLDTPIQRSLADFRIEVPFDDAPPITLRQLMCHRSGMVRESPVGGYLDPTQPSLGKTVASLASCVLVNSPNTKTRYSNLGPTIVGQAVTVASGQEFAAYQREHVLGPLGMSQSAWSATDQIREHLATGTMRVADGRGGFTRRTAPQFELGTIPAGNLYSTAGDLARFAKMVLAEGRTADGRPLVSAERLREMGTPQLIQEDTGFGLGFHVSKFQGHRSLRHMGAVYGFTSSIVMLPEAGIAVIVLTNEDIANGPVIKISNTALEQMLQAKLGEKPPVPPAEVPLDAATLAALAGQYESPSYWAEVKVVNGALWADVSGQPMTLRPIGPLEFEADGQYVHRERVAFGRNASDQITGFTALDQTFTRLAPGDRRAIPEAWRKYLGSYGPEFIPLVISERHGRLYAMTENMFDYRLTPVNQVVFRMPEGLYTDEYLVFELDESGRPRRVNLANMTLPRLERP